MTLTVICLIFAAIPCALFLVNLLAYRRLPMSRARTGVSVLIPARNEERNIRATLEAALQNKHPIYEVIVLDDGSTDRTAEIVREFAARDCRVRLEQAPALPPDWCGKQHACHVLSQRAHHPLLLFIDADVRLAPSAIARLAAYMENNDVALASGVPRQELGTLSERLLLPLIHFVLLGFLPMHMMRRTRWPAMSGGCGQLFIARRDAYEACGGHAQICSSLHDGIQLPRAFRRAGSATDLFDATDLATCRMYRTNTDTWHGLGKNAVEALAAPATIVPVTAMFLLGQVLPFILLFMKPSPLAAFAAILALLPRVIAAARFRQPLGAALLHPVAITGLLVLQWRALTRHILGRPAKWKGRSYAAIKPVRFLLIFSASICAADFPAIELRDQFDRPHQLAFPRQRVTILTIADRKGSDQVGEWISALKARYGERVEFRGIAEVGSVPSLLQNHVRKKFQERFKYPVMMDWSGKVSDRFGGKSGVANVIVLGPDGNTLGRASGNARESAVRDLCATIDKAL